MDRSLHCKPHRPASRSEMTAELGLLGKEGRARFARDRALPPLNYRKADAATEQQIVQVRLEGGHRSPRLIGDLIAPQSTRRPCAGEVDHAKTFLDSGRKTIPLRDVIASDQISRSPEPFSFAQDKLREGVAIRRAVSLRDAASSAVLVAGPSTWLRTGCAISPGFLALARNDPSTRLRAGLSGQLVEPAPSSVEGSRSSQRHFHSCVWNSG